MENNSLTRNMFTEKLFEAIEEPWSNESTPSSTPAKKIKPVRKTVSASLTLDVQCSDGVKSDVLQRLSEPSSGSLDDEPDFIVWKLAEKLFMLQMRNMGALAFVRWANEIKRSMKSKRLSQKARILHRRKLQLKMFNSWYGSVILVSRFAKKKVQIEKFGKVKIQRFLSICFESFKRATLSIHLNSAMQRRYCYRLLRSCIEKWRKESVVRARNYTKSLKMAYKLCLRGAFRSWSCHAISNRRLESVLRVFQRRMVRKLIGLCFKRWYHSKMTTSLMPSKNAWLAHYLDSLLRKRCTAAIKAWNQISVHRRQVRSVFLKTLCRKMFAGQVSHESSCLQSAISCWVEKTREKGRPGRSAFTQRKGGSKGVLLSDVFKTWAKCCVVDAQTNTKASRHRLVKLKTFLKQCYHSWKNTAKSARTAAKKADSLFKYRNANRKIRAFMVWKHVLASSLAASVLSADTFCMNTLKRKHRLLWNRWKQRALRRVALGRAYKSRSRQRLTIYFSLRTLFWEWKMGILSEQFFARYTLSRFFVLWKQLMDSSSSCVSPLDAAMAPSLSSRILEKDVIVETKKSSTSQIYRRKVLRLAVHGWAWSCSHHSALLEKLQIAYMIRSSIRTSTRVFSAWANETLKTSNTSIIPVRPVTPISSNIRSSPEPNDDKQRTFEILNIALVERILWNVSKKRLIQQMFKLWLEFSQSSAVSRKLLALRRMRCSFLIWARFSRSIAIQHRSRLTLPAIKRWKMFADRNSTLQKLIVGIKAKSSLTQKIRGMFAWCKYTFGITRPNTNKRAFQSSQSIQRAWKDAFFPFQIWHRWTKTSVCRFSELETTAKTRFVDTMCRNHFFSWWVYTCNLRRSKISSQSNTIRSMRVVYQAWSRCTFVKRKADKLIVSLQNYQATSMLILCWNAWRAGLEQRNYRTLTLSVTGKLIQKCNSVSVPVRIAWNAWRNFISTRRFVRLAKEKIARKIYEKANFRNMFRKWRSAGRRRRNISCALAKVRSTILRRAFFAMKYSILRTVFFARQYQRISIKFQRRSKSNSPSSGFPQNNTKNMNQDSSKCDSQLDLGILEETILKLQSEKIDLMEQLKCALQGMQKESVTEASSHANKKETLQRSHMNENTVHINDSRPAYHRSQDETCQHPLFPVQPRRQQSSSSKAPLLPNSLQQQHQHPLFPVLPRNDDVLGDLKHNDEPKVTIPCHIPHATIHLRVSHHVFTRWLSCLLIRHQNLGRTRTPKWIHF